MAKSWCGFLPQNQHIIQQWGYMEASTSDVIEALHVIGFLEDEEAQIAFDPDKFSDEGWSGTPK